MLLTMLQWSKEVQRANALMVIVPYWYQGTWVFDDESVELNKEPFVAGVPEILDNLVKVIPHARSGFRLIFSSAPFPGYQKEFIRLREEYGGNWYRVKDQPIEGWLCPALLEYFESAPEKVYVRAEVLPPPSLKSQLHSARTGLPNTDKQSQLL